MEYSLKDKTILTVALITTFIGLFSLFCIMFFKTDKFVYINNIDTDDKVSMIGVAKNFSYYHNTTRFILYQECNIEVIAFNELINSSHVSVQGKVQDYKGKKTIIADKIFSLE